MKVVPPDIGARLSARSLAYWSMDDGALHGNGGFYLCTDSFTREDVLLLCSVLNEKFGLACAAVPLPLAATKGCGQGGRTSLGPNVPFIGCV